MAVVRLVTEVVLQLLELSLVFREDDRVLIDGGTLLVDSGQSLSRAGLFLAEFPHQIRAVREPRQLAGDSSHPFLQSPLVAEGTERGLPVDVRPKRSDLAMQLIDPVLDLVPALLVLPFGEIELPLGCAGCGFSLLVRRLRLFQAVEFLAQAVEVVRLFLKDGSFGFELRGDLPLVPDLRYAGLEGLEPGRAVFQGRGRSDPTFVLRIESLRLLGMDLEVRLELRHAIPADLPFLVQISEIGRASCRERV